MTDNLDIHLARVHEAASASRQANKAYAAWKFALEDALHEAESAVRRTHGPRPKHVDAPDHEDPAAFKALTVAVVDAFGHDWLEAQAQDNDNFELVHYGWDDGVCIHLAAGTKGARIYFRVPLPETAVMLESLVRQIKRTVEAATAAWEEGP
jgi:hypothetical protein